MIKRFFVILIMVIGSVYTHAQPQKEKWIDSVFSQLSETEKIGQLFMMPVSSDLESNKIDNVEKDIRFDNIGGVLFTTGHPLKQVNLTNQFQSISKVPLFIAFDASHGLGTWLDSTVHFPNPLALGAIESDSLIYVMGKEIGRELKLLGVSFNLSPVANLYSENQTYNSETYGQDRQRVTQKLLAYHHGLRSEGILGCAKYFPVKGISITTVEKGVPVIQSSVDTAQTYPFQQLFNQGIAAVMPASAELPVVFENKNAEKKNKFSNVMLSSFFAGDYIKKQMQFNGLLIVDLGALKDSTENLKDNDAALLAFQAGNDIFLTEDNPGPSIRKIKKLIRKQKQYNEQLTRSVRKILAAKYDAGLFNRRIVNTENLMLKLNSPEAQVLQQQLFKGSITVARNTNNTIPLRALENRNFASVVIGDTSGISRYHKMTAKYINAKKFYVTGLEDSTRIKSILQNHHVVLVARTSRTPIAQAATLLPLFQKQSQDQEIILVDFGSDAGASYTSDHETIIASFSDQPEMLSAVPQAIFGGLNVSGSLPIDFANAKAGTSIPVKSLRRFEYTTPEAAGLSGSTLKKIEAIAQEAISSESTPGCYVLVAKDGKIVYERSFGHLTYEKQMPVTDSTIYDLASVTKVSSTLQTIMFLYDRGMIDLNKKASVYLPELKNSNKKDFTVKDILTHQAGLWPFIPFYVHTMKDSSYLPGYYDSKPSIEFPYMVAEKLYTHGAMKDTLWSWSIKGKIREKPARTPFDYKYSDIGFYIMQHLAEKLLNQPIEDFVQQNLYEPLGAYTTGYLPLLRFPISRIAPTENDKYFRKSLLIGTVHDPGAAMHGGVAGHAGLFSTANDLAKLGQMLLQDGYYGGYQYYKPETVRLFSQKQYDSNHRGLGWAKSIQSDWSSPTSLYASPRTFGHTGYTGTCIWMDPEFNLLYIFLSNRVHPEVRTKLLTTNIRTRIQDVIYQSVFDYCKTKKTDLFIDNSFNSSAR